MGTCNNFDYTISTQPCTNVDVGFDFSSSLTYEDNGTAINLTGYIFVMTIKASLGGSILLTLPIVGNNTTTGLYIPAPTNGQIFVQILEADTITVGNGIFPYEMTITDSFGLESIFMQGTIEFIDRGY
jgi:hypothetical protein